MTDTQYYQSLFAEYAKKNLCTYTGTLPGRRSLTRADSYRGKYPAARPMPLPSTVDSHYTLEYKEKILNQFREAVKEFNITTVDIPSPNEATPEEIRAVYQVLAKALGMVKDGELYPLTNKLDYVFFKRKMIRQDTEDGHTNTWVEDYEDYKE